MKKLKSEPANAFSSVIETISFLFKEKLTVVVQLKSSLLKGTAKIEASIPLFKISPALIPATPEGTIVVDTGTWKY